MHIFLQTNSTHQISVISGIVGKPYYLTENWQISLTIQFVNKQLYLPIEYFKVMFLLLLVRVRDPV